MVDDTNEKNTVYGKSIKGGNQQMWSPSEIYSHKQFLDIYTSARNMEYQFIDSSPILLYKFKLERLGYIKAKLYHNNQNNINKCVSKIKILAKNKKIPKIEIHTSQRISSWGNNVDFSKGTYILTLENRTKDDLWKKLNKKVKNQVRKAEKSEVVCKQTTDVVDLKKWWDIYLETGKRGGFVLQKYEMVEKLFLNSKISRLFIALIKGKIIAGAFLLVGNCPLYWLGGSLKKYGKYNGSTLIQWEIIKWAKESGYCYYDMGGALKDNKDHGPSRFKKQFGGDFSPVYIYEMEFMPFRSKFFKILANLYYKFSKTTFRGL